MKITALLLAAAIAAPALAQTTTTTTTATADGQQTTTVDANGQRIETGPERTAPVTQANAGVAADVAVDGAERQMANADVRAEYDADLLAYDQSVMAHHRAVRRDDAAYMHQQRAYADAMAQWRFQTAQCKRGVLKMCSLPTPDPANYF